MAGLPDGLSWGQFARPHRVPEWLAVRSLIVRKAPSVHRYFERLGKLWPVSDPRRQKGDDPLDPSPAGQRRHQVGMGCALPLTDTEASRARQVVELLTRVPARDGYGIGPINERPLIDPYAPRDQEPVHRR